MAQNAPMYGPTMNTQKLEGQVLVTMAGPRERAGLIEHPSIGSSTAWAQKTAKPIARGAKLLDIALCLFLPVSSTTMHSTVVITISPKSALPNPTPGEIILLPRVFSLPSGIVP
mmetsp:Transcript_3975/g.8063  ORF Transcript_3975/g.8063 Transcript_3975/m.8063 type:complete len:114 (+) Transcript_3975:735-1076(+)